MFLETEEKHLDRGYSKLCDKRDLGHLKPQIIGPNGGGSSHWDAPMGLAEPAVDPAHSHTTDQSTEERDHKLNIGVAALSWARPESRETQAT